MDKSKYKSTSIEPIEMFCDLRSAFSKCIETEKGQLVLNGIDEKTARMIVEKRYIEKISEFSLPVSKILFQFFNQEVRK